MVARGGDGTITRALAARIRISPDRLSRDAVSIAGACLLDWLGVTLMGAREPDVNLLVADALAEGGGKARLVGRTESVRVVDAALINGFASHVLDYDDGLPAMVGHASVAIVPALFALAETAPVNGNDFLRAFVTGVEMAGCLGSLVAPGHYEKGFHATGTIGALAAAAACATLIGLDDDRIVAALGLAGTRAAGLKCSFGTVGKPLHAGWASVVGVTAARWAARGMVGADDVIGDPQGFAVTHGPDFHPDRALAPANGGFHVLDTRFKRYATCGVTHSAIDALLHLREQHRLRPDAVTGIDVHIGSVADRICNIQTPMTALDLKFSLKWIMAMAFNGVDLANPGVITAAMIERQDIADLAGRTKIVLEPDRNVTDSEVVIHMRDCTTLRCRRVGAYHARSPDEAVAQVEAKFRSLAADILGDDCTQVVVAAVAALDHMPDASTLLTLVRPRATSGCDRFDNQGDAATGN